MHSSIRNLFVCSGRRPIRGTLHRTHLRLEALEDRMVPSTFTVLNTNDSGPGSLRQAVLDANANGGADTIVFGDGSTSGGANFLDATPDTITLTSGQLTLTDTATTTIIGPGPALLSISGNDASRVFQLSGATSSLSGITITGGKTAASGGGVFNSGGILTLTGCNIIGNSADHGGGVLNDGTATLTNCTVSGNTATGEGGGLSNADNGVMMVTNCTVSGNTCGNLGGGIIGTSHSVRLVVTNSTITGNSARVGGGIEMWWEMTLTNCTITGNSDGVHIVNPLPCVLNNTIVANNGSNLTGRAPTGGSNNLIGDAANTQSLTDTIIGDPLLSPLANNGGPTQTMALLPGSPAIDAGNPANAPATDQRGVMRTGNTDIGAFEVTVTPPVVQLIAVGADAGGGPQVGAFDAATGNEILNFFAYDPVFTGGVRVATGDVNGDGATDIITGAGPGGGPHVKVFDGVTGAEIRSFFAYDAAFAGGVYVGAADVNNDGFADIITGAGPGGGPHVKVFDGQTNSEIRSFFAYDAAFAGGVRVAGGDVNDDNFGDIITGAGPGGGPHVKVFSGQDGETIRTYFAFDPKFVGGVFVAAGDVNGDDFAEVVISAQTSTPINIFDGRTNALNASFAPYNSTNPSEMRIAIADFNGDHLADILMCTGPGVPPEVRQFAGNTLQELDRFFAFEPAFPGGAFVGGA